MGKNSYIGGSTVIGPGSRWFSKSNPNVEKKLSPSERAAKQRRQCRAAAKRRAAKAELKARNLELNEEKKQQAALAKAARDADPKHQAILREKRAKRKEQRKRHKAVLERREIRKKEIVVEKRSKGRILSTRKGL